MFQEAGQHRKQSRIVLTGYDRNCNSSSRAVRPTATDLTKNAVFQRIVSGTTFARLTDWRYMDSTQRGAPHGCETILIVAEDKPNRSLLGLMLRRSGYRVLEARHSGQALLNCLGPEPIHLVLTDLTMSEMTGYELVCRLALLRPGIKALYIMRNGATDNGSPELDACLQAPFTTATLAWKVRSVLDESPCR